MEPIVNPYINKKIDTSIIVTPDQFNNDLKKHIFNNIKKRDEKKCNHVGYVNEIYSLVDEEIKGKIDVSNQLGNCKFLISYYANICIPIPNTQIIAKITEINQIIKAEHRNIIIIIKINNIDLTKFKLINMRQIQYIKTGSNIENTYVKVLLKSTKITKNNNVIYAMGFLTDVATDKEIEEYIT